MHIPEYPATARRGSNGDRNGDRTGIVPQFHFHVASVKRGPVFKQAAAHQDIAPKVLPVLLWPREIDIGYGIWVDGCITKSWSPSCARYVKMKLGMNCGLMIACLKRDPRLTLAT